MPFTMTVIQSLIMGIITPLVMSVDVNAGENAVATTKAGNAYGDDGHN